MEEHPASIFRVKLSRVVMWLDYMGRLHERWSFRSRGGRRENRTWSMLIWMVNRKHGENKWFFLGPLYCNIYHGWNSHCLNVSSHLDFDVSLSCSWLIHSIPLHCVLLVTCTASTELTSHLAMCTVLYLFLYTWPPCYHRSIWVRFLEKSSALSRDEAFCIFRRCVKEEEVWSLY
jgi:hypothetical protein